jgi:hypothetical protein
VSEFGFRGFVGRFQYERERDGFYRAAVVFSARRARRAVRFAAQDAAGWWVCHQDRVRAARHEAAALAVRDLEVAFANDWGGGASVAV